jgi:hypothetical protein
MSRISFWLCTALLLVTALFYYPKWKQLHTEATISWDVSGYYLYLPAAIIYKDITQLAWWEAVSEKYHPGPGMGQAMKHPSGNYVMKYPMGQALQFLPWFLTAHLLAEPLGFPADGFSAPYQAAISWGSLLIAFLGLWFLRRVLLNYFSEGITATVLVSIVFGSNYLEYASITGAMTHNWLFTLYSILIYTCIQFYQNPSKGKAAIIGLLVGWATLTRPTEIISALIPLLWGINSWAAARARLQFFKENIEILAVSVLTAAFVMLLQPMYWKYATGEWIVYSYEDQGFTWFPPHIESVLWSAKAGWLIYSPMMVFAVIGLFMLRKRLPEIAPTILLFCLLALYITSAWDIWWYGGSLGQRAMVQAYPLWAFALGAFWYWVAQRNWRRYLFIPLAGICVYLNLWWSHQAHKGGLFLPEQMTRRYNLKVMGRFDVERDWMKLLDTKDEFKGKERNNTRPLFNNPFDSDTTQNTSADSPIKGARSLVLNQEKQFSPVFQIPQSKDQQSEWYRAFVTFRCSPKEWDWWAMTQFVIRFKSGETTVKECMIRLQRHVNGNEVKDIYFDTKRPNKDFDKIELLFWNAGSNKTVLLDDVGLEGFDY